MKSILFLGTEDDKPYLPFLKGMCEGASVFIVTQPVTLLLQLTNYCNKRGITSVFSTNTEVLAKLLALRGNPKNSPSLADYAGSLFVHDGIEIVFIPPLSQVRSVPYGEFLATRYISKLISPTSWVEPTDFRWAVLQPETFSAAWEILTRSFAIAVDIETFKERLAIRCVGYTAVYEDAGVIRTASYVLPLDSQWALAVARKINALPIDKITQRGKYDHNYLLRYNAPCHSWMWDTANLAHCFMCELPKDLAFQNAFFLRSVIYWKDLAETNDLQEYYRYNALDTWATANVWIVQMLTFPEWAFRNYVKEFPLNFPCLLSELTGIERDMERLEKVRAAGLAKEERALTSVRRMVGNKDFNPSSPPQTVQLLKVLGIKDATSSDEKNIARAMYAHPLNARILGQILEYRGFKKERTTYLRTDADKTKESGKGYKEFRGRILYALNPDGTDTARLASREHHFWCGLQIQNIPRDGIVKSTLCASAGFLLAEADLEQAESRDTAFISGDETLIIATTQSGDFHSFNASKFFGVPYEQIYDDKTGKKLRKDLRDTGKPINHGANYNMGPAVLVDSMGYKLLYEARTLLKLPFTDALEIAEALLTTFHLTYKTLRGIIQFRSMKVARHFGVSVNPQHKLFAPGTYYAKIAEEVRTTGKIVSRAFHHTRYAIEKGLDPVKEIELGDWTRRAFGRPHENKMELNALAAHPSQSLNARTLNEAYMQVFYEVALPNPTTFRLHAQIHDSILFSFAEGHLHHAHKVRELMEIPVTVRDVNGAVRTFTVPAALKAGKQGQGVKYWSDTE